ncbi:tetratricopeptide repeat protein [Luteolibacter marinus]|uniref:tetratricopeptide repeat protein n=1 Tax=Luteolibacter marinus TaxID=2776705 RepID=UPI00186801A7|nr:tetratricopeptide repeat protein [Luteolibacter marinus]
MKAFPRAILFCLLPLSVLHAQDPKEPAKEVPAFQQEFLNLPEEKRNDFAKLGNEAHRLFGQKRVFEALDKINEAKAIFKDSPELLTLEGACQVEFRNFDKAIELFKQADALAPGERNSLFNLAELHFVTKNWDAAEASLNKLLEMQEGEPDPGALQMFRLIEFKLLLTKIKLGKMEEATKLSTKYDYLDDSPFPYYAEAAIAFANGDEVKAESAMARGTRIFQNPAVLSPWQDTMIEFGYIKGFFGGDMETPAAASE